MFSFCTNYDQIILECKYKSIKDFSFHKYTFSERDFVFTEKPRDVHVMVNESVSVRACVPNANNVYWCKGGDKVHAISTSFTEDFDEPYASLTLKNARLHDQGEYICVAEKYGNETKRIRSRFTINVNEGK